MNRHVNTSRHNLANPEVVGLNFELQVISPAELAALQHAREAFVAFAHTSDGESIKNEYVEDHTSYTEEEAQHLAKGIYSHLESIRFVSDPCVPTDDEKKPTFGKCTMIGDNLATFGPEDETWVDHVLKNTNLSSFERLHFSAMLEELAETATEDGDEISPALEEAISAAVRAMTNYEDEVAEHGGPGLVGDDLKAHTDVTSSGGFKLDDVRGASSKGKYLWGEAGWNNQTAVTPPKPIIKPIHNIYGNVVGHYCAGYETQPQPEERSLLDLDLSDVTSSEKAQGSLTDMYPNGIYHI